MAQQIKFYKGTSFDSFVAGGVYFETSTGLIKVGRNGGVDVFGGDVKDVVFDEDSKVLTVSFNSGKDNVELSFADCASKAAMDKALGDLEARVKAIEDDYLKGADKTELEGKITTEAERADAAEKANAKAIADEVKRAGDAEKVNADAIGVLEGLHAKDGESFKSVADEVSAGISGIAEVSKSSTAGESVVVTVVTEAGSVKSVSADASVIEARVKALEDDSADADALKAEIERATAAEEALADRLDVIEGEGEGSIKKAADDAEKAANDYTDQAIEDLDLDNTYAAKSYEAKVDTLIGDDANKSVRTIANEELAAQLIPENAKESLDTLKEIADWIQAHPEDAAAMNSAIEALQTLVGSIPADATATTIVGLIQELVGAEASRAEGVEGDLDDAIKAEKERAEGAEGDLSDAIDAEKERAEGVESDLDEAIKAEEARATAAEAKALQDAKDYADSLAGNYATAAQGVKADSALQSVSATAAGSTFISATASAKADNAQAITVTVTMGSMNDDKVTVKSDGFATVADVANAVAAGVSATTLVGASAEDGDIKVTVENNEISAELSWALFS